MKFDIQNDGGQNSFHTSLFKDLFFFLVIDQSLTLYMEACFPTE